jgi:hypothetical protein
MMRWLATWIAAVAFGLLPGCSRVADRNSAVEQHPSIIAPVSFDLEPLQSSDGSQQWIGVHHSPGKIARFRMDFGAPETTPGEPGVKSGEGTLLPEPGSDSSALLIELQKALQAKAAFQVPPTKTSVPFTYINIGDHLSQTPTGEFIANPPGNWTAMRLILGDGARESQIFLHIDAGTKKGQFSMKDASYGDLALAELAKVL